MTFMNNVRKNKLDNSYYEFTVEGFDWKMKETTMILQLYGKIDFLVGNKSTIYIGKTSNKINLYKRDKEGLDYSHTLLSCDCESTLSYLEMKLLKFIKDNYKNILNKELTKIN